ncbi:MAG TPA: hypothetical protein IAA08_03625 [Candidatus Eubacterium avistercoris]|uniref:XRE family transcriptional regulator n=1 Tax=Candidatus Eubacterium avistercoris TaxID=2838567 RepID=A0A9D2D1X1_9FIRM|nr:hypothetical protein [Candidatus Eubacterium avistercoris]
MPVFAEVLKYYINESHVSVRKLSMEAGIDRTLIHKYMADRRIPKSIEEVKRLGRCLMLSSEKQKQLLESYNQSLYGEERYRGFLTIQQILLGVPDFQIQKNPEIEGNHSNIEHLFPGSDQKAVAFYGQIQVEDALLTLLLSEVQKQEKVKVKMIAQPDNPCLIRVLLKGYWKENMEIEQIICLDDSNQSNHNISVIAHLLPLLQGDVSYQAYYYYDNQKAHINLMSLTPILLLINEYIVFCNLSMNECLIIKDPVEYEFYTRQYTQIKMKADLLTEGGKIPNQSVEFLCPEYKTEEQYIYIGTSPCIASCMTPELLYCHLLIPDEKKKENFVHTVMNNTKTAIEKRYISNVFTEQGFRMLIERGMTAEYPEEMYVPLNESERGMVVRRMMQYGKEGKVKWYMANSQYLNLDPRLCIYCNNKQGVSFVKWKENTLMQSFTVNEISIKRSFFDFLDFARENGWIYSETDTVRKMEEIYNEYFPKKQHMKTAE